MNEHLALIVDAYKEHFGDHRPVVVWDVGSRDGDDGVALAEALGGGVVVCVEPNPPQAQLIREKHPKVVVHEVAVSDYEGESEFVRVVSDSKDAVGMSSLDVANQDTKGLDPKEVIKVQVKRLDSLLPEGTVDVMKIDCEGYSWEVLHGLGKRLKDIKVLHVETEHPEFSDWSHPGHKNNEQVMAFMRAKGFDLYATDYEWGGIQDQIWVNASLVARK